MRTKERQRGHQREEKRKRTRRISIAWRGNSSCCLPWDNIEMATCGTNRCSRYYKTRLNCERTAPRRWDYVDVLAWDRWIDARSLSFTCPRPCMISKILARKTDTEFAPRCENKFQEQHVPEILGAFTRIFRHRFCNGSPSKASRADCKGDLCGF